MSVFRRKINRRTFLKYSATTSSAAYLGWGLSAEGAGPKADLALVNGKILTVDPRDRIAEAVAVRGDRILSVGTNKEIGALIGRSTEVIDLGRKTATPGLIDSHIHTMYYGRQFWPGFLNIRYPYIETLDELKDAISARDITTPSGGWISGNQGFIFNTQFDRWVIDPVSGDHPVYLRHNSGQYSVVNSAALEKVGYDKFEKDPFGGKIIRLEDGTPTGVLLHYPAENLVMHEADGYKDLSDEDLENDLRRAQDMLLASGVTSGQDVIVGSYRDLMIYKNLADKGELKMRMYLHLYINSEEQAQQYVQQLSRYESDYVTFGGWKLAIDGGVAAGTAIMYEKPGGGVLPAAQRSYYYYEPEMLNRIVRLLHDTGMQISFHIVGDKGIDQALDALEAATRARPKKGFRHRIEHACYVQEDSLARIKELGVVISTQPAWITWFGDGYESATSGTASKFMPIKTMLQMNIPLAFGCDVPAAPFHDPKWAFVGATTRRTMGTGQVLSPDQIIGMRAALRVHTMGSAYAAFEEDRKGSIEEGKLADIVVWNKDLYSLANPQEAMDLEALMTIVGGEVVYEKK